MVDVPTENSGLQALESFSQASCLVTLGYIVQEQAFRVLIENEREARSLLVKCTIKILLTGFF